MSVSGRWCHHDAIDFPIRRPRSLINRKAVGDDARAGLVLGVESVPDGLAAGLLAGVNPVAGLYAYLYGLVGGALFTSTAFMAVQATSAMAIIIADVDLGARDDPERALFTLSVLTGVVMIVAGLLRLGSILRFVSNSVLTGFITAVGINIVLGQLDDFTGYAAEGGGRISRAIDLLLHFWQVDLWTLAVGLVTVVLIVVLQRTPLGALGLVVGIIAGSGLAAIFDAFDRDIAQLGDIAAVPNSLPFITMPAFGDIPALLLPAASLAFVGLVQGAGVSANFPNEDGTPTNASQDFVGQGAGNIVSGLFQGMPVGGSVSASSIAATAGAKSRASLLFAALTMVVAIVVFAASVELIAMPALAGLLMVIGVSTIKPSRVMAVARTGTVPLTVMTITLALTMVIPLQFSVLVGVGISVILFVAQQSTTLVVKQLAFDDEGRVEEIEVPDELGANDVIVVHPVGSLFFANAPTLLAQLPSVTPATTNSVVVLRLRGIDDAGATLIGALRGYATDLRASDSKMIVVTDNSTVIRQLRVTGTADVIGVDNIYQGDRFVGSTVRRAHADALEWVDAHRGRRPDENVDNLDD